MFRGFELARDRRLMVGNLQRPIRGAVDSQAGSRLYLHGRCFRAPRSRLAFLFAVLEQLVL
eukprot:6064664-Pyramimonas_sp.AAC.1